jgi:hypothetical protein
MTIAFAGMLGGLRGAGDSPQTSLLKLLRQPRTAQLMQDMALAAENR